MYIADWLLLSGWGKLICPWAHFYNAVDKPKNAQSHASDGHHKMLNDLTMPSGLGLEVSPLRPLSKPQLVHFSTIQLVYSPKWMNQKQSSS